MCETYTEGGARSGAKVKRLMGNNNSSVEVFIRKAREVHGDRYDYSKVEYVNSKTKIRVVCLIHGEFLVRPDIHLQGCICKKCQFEKQKRLIFNKGYNDLLEESHTQAYKIWKHMLMRCYDDNFKRKYPTYEKCVSCEEWLLFSNFKNWFDKNYVDGWQLDKDILIKGNKIYSPQTCCFVPQHINGALAKSFKKRGNHCIGVVRHGRGFRAMIRINNQHHNLGTFATEEEAFCVYKKAKETAIKSLADEYKSQLDPVVYEALYNYKVEISD